jgi:hypothetical protein
MERRLRESRRSGDARTQARHAQVGEIRKRVTSRKQAIAIGLSEAPRAGGSGAAGETLLLVEEKAVGNSRRGVSPAAEPYFSMMIPASSVSVPSVWKYLYSGSLGRE